MVFRWIAAALLAALALLVDASNVWGPIAARRRGGGYSTFPLLGAICGVAAYSVSPWPPRWPLVLGVISLDVTVFLLLAWFIGKSVAFIRNSNF